MTLAATDHPLTPETGQIVAANRHACIRRAAPVARFSLRARGDLAGLEAALGLALPQRIGQRSQQDSRAALRLGPDEWLLHCAPDEAPALAAACGALYPGTPHSLVDISGREETLVIEGPALLDLLSTGMARDPGAIPAGDGRRVNFDGVTVVLWRDAPDRVRLDVWHSFMPHVLGLLTTALRELAAEAP